MDELMKAGFVAIEFATAAFIICGAATMLFHYYKLWQQEDE